MVAFSDISEAAKPTKADTRLALESSRRLVRLLRGRSKKNLALRVRVGGAEETIAVPGPAFRMFADLLAHLARGAAVALVPVDAEVTTQQAADLLNVSRPFLIEQLDKSLIPYRKVGSHRRMLLRDVLAYKQRTDRNRLGALEELSALDQKLRLGY